MAFYDFAKHQKPLATQSFWAPEKLSKIPYKFCRLLILLGLFSQKCPQKHQKSIRFFTINDMPFRHVAKPYKTNGKSMILETPKPSKVAHEGPPLFLHSSFFILHSSSSFFILHLHSSFFILHSSSDEE